MKAQLIILLAVYGITQATLSKFDCKLGKYCLCTPMGAEYMFECPKYESKLTIRIFANDEIKIECGSAEIDWNSEYIPKLKGSVSSITFLQCHLPGNITRVIKKLITNDTQELKITYSNFNSTLTFDHLENLEKLTLNENNIEDIQIPFTLSKLTEVNLGASKIKLSNNMFQYLSKLRLLDLSEKNLENLPVGLFRNLPELKILYLGSNQLTKLDKNVFKNLHNLQALELRSNQLEDLPEDIFQDLKYLTHLSLVRNKLNSIPANLFANNEVLQGIHLGENQGLVTLPDGLFSNLTELQFVLLETCNLSKLPDSLFHECTQLQTIALQGNQLEELPKDIFKDLSGLQELDLSYNKLTDLPEEIFSSLTELKSLNLESNMLSEISETLFYNLQNLEVLNLKSNLIGFIDSGAFVRIVSLKEVVLANNYLDIFKDEGSVSPFNNNHNLEKVDLSHNNIIQVGDGWWANGVLKELDLSYNLITFVNFVSVLGMSKPLMLNLSNNKINTVYFLGFEERIQNTINPTIDYLTSGEIGMDLHENSFDKQEILQNYNFNITLSDTDINGNFLGMEEPIEDSELELDLYQNVLEIEETPSYSSSNMKIIVDLNANPMNCNCGIYDFIRYLDTGMTHLEVLADNLICSSPESTKELSVTQLKPDMLTCTLDELEMNSTCPENCECRIRLWDKAFIINCTNKNLTNIPELALPQYNIINQIVVYLQQNLLEEGPKADMGYENVTKLYLSSNKINEVAWIPANIELLYLDKNNISHLSYDALSMLNKSTLTNISLGNNPWGCDCSDSNLTNFLVQSLNSKQMDVNDIKCQQNKKLLVHLTTSDLCPNYTSLILGILCVVALLVATCTAVFYNYKQEIKVWLFANNTCLWFITEEEMDKDKIYDAFISYSHKDEDFVLNELLPVLEQGPKPYKLCIHVRNWLAGELIGEQIVKSVKESRRTIVIVSPHFLKSVWGKIEFQTAHSEAMIEGRARVIVLLYGDVNIDTDLDNELKAYISTKTYVKWGERWFWDKLRYALPHASEQGTQV